MAHGVAGLYLASGVSFLRAEESVFEAMVTGWRAQQLGGRGLGEDYVTGTVRAVRQFHAHAGSCGSGTHAGMSPPAVPCARGVVAVVVVGGIVR